MQHRDKVILQKIISEIDVGTQMLGSTALEACLQNELLNMILAQAAE